ncbi:uncharacterized protein LOC142168430 [Nicotiana tabacum]|uniref:Uncharacterized protein LOC142168430 n=1 Tax=Nicotiana tabacum TaxID=4097 RepID=A0AC58SJQ0_TOBAC
MATDIRDFINKYDVCQRHKYYVAASPGLLQPLPVPDGVWTDICLDFIEGLPRSHGKDVILVVLDKLSNPYEILYGQKPPLHLLYLAGEVVLEMVDRSLAAREAIIHLLKFHLLRAQQVFVATRPFNKLDVKYYGPYPIISKIETIAYKLLIPADVLIHPTFHVSQLKKCHEVPTNINHPHVFHLSSPYCPLHEQVLARRMVKRGNKVVVQVLVKWTGIDVYQATWEYVSELQHRFPSF